jgi:hypothetical protein
MAGRNGNDDIGKLLMVLYLILAIVNIFAKSLTLQIIEFLIFFYWIFRVFSRNLFARRKENEGFLRIIHGIKAFFFRLFAKIGFRHQEKPHASRIKKVKTVKPKKQEPIVDKDHVLRDCPICKRSLKLRKIKGERLVLCPACHNEVRIKI